MAFTSTPDAVNSNSTARVISSNTTNSTLVNGAGTRLDGFYVFNTTATNKFLKFYDKVTAPTVGTDTPKMTIQVPGTAAGTTSNPIYISFGDNKGIWFTSGLGLGITGAVGDSDTTSTAAGDVYLTVSYMGF